MIKWKKYKGAGVLFVFSEQKGTYEILLGKRRYRPDPTEGIGIFPAEECLGEIKVIF